jgi:hypothetical protein
MKGEGSVSFKTSHVSGVCKVAVNVPRS